MSVTTSLPAGLRASRRRGVQREPGPRLRQRRACVGLYDEIVVETIDSGLIVEVEGRAPATSRTPMSTSWCGRSITAWPPPGRAPPGLILRCRNAIPHSRGLGSSAAAVVGGLAAANGLVAQADLELLTESRLIQLSSEFEGHPDNASAAVLGGAVVSWAETVHDSPAYAAARVRLHPDIHLRGHPGGPFVDRGDPRAATGPGQPRSGPVQRQPRRPAGDRLDRAPLTC